MARSKRRFPRAEVAIEPDDHARNQQGAPVPGREPDGRRTRPARLQAQSRLIANRTMIAGYAREELRYRRQTHQRHRRLPTSTRSTGFATVAQKNQGLGDRNWALPRSASPAPTFPRRQPKTAALARIAGYHGEMDYMAKHAPICAPRQQLLAARQRCRSFLPGCNLLASRRRRTASARRPGTAANISRYALGRDYHKTVRKRLQKLAELHASAMSPPATPVCSPVLPGVFRFCASSWKSSSPGRPGLPGAASTRLSLTRNGSWHFLGEIYLSLPLPADKPIDEHCGTCQRCIDACPTAAIVAPYECGRPLVHLVPDD
jgi:ferredoxin